jgi:pimeloyl-ACP methyl ester carboxylesterase
VAAGPREVVFETYRQFPQRCDSLVALFGPAGHVLRNTRLPLSGSLIAGCFEHLSSRLLAATCRAIELGFRAPWTQSVGHKLGVIGSRAPRPDIDQVLAHMATVDLTTLRQLFLSAEQHSAEPVLPRLRVPLLIVAADRDRFAPPGCVALPMHAAACGSTLVRLPHATHTALLEEPELIASVVENFVSTPHVVTRA